jgi:hypothetical protein
MLSNPGAPPDLERKRAELDALERRRTEYRDLEQRRGCVSPVRRYWDDPVAFAADCIAWPEGQFLTEYQQESLASLVTNRRECTRGPRGLGKTCEEAIAIHWFALTRDGEDWKCVTSAGSWHQLTAYLWPEVHKWARRLRWDVIGRHPYVEGSELLTMSLKLTTGQATAASPERADLIEGAHADHVMLVLDEAKVIPNAIFDAVEGTLSTGECYALCCSTPGEPSGRFYDIHSRTAATLDWHASAVTTAQVIGAGRMNPEWAEQRRIQWGEGSALYVTQVNGEFASSAEDLVIPLAWVEAANARWEIWRDRGVQPSAPTCVGVDVARGGADKTALALRSGPVITELREYAYADTMETTGQVVGVMRAGALYAVVDVIGVGAGVVDRLREEGFNVVAFNAGERSDALDISGELGFANKRSAAWWAMREFLDPANDPQIALPPEELLTGDLTAPRWRVTSTGKIAVESKDDIRKRIGRSTDYADAVIQAFYTPPVLPTQMRVVYEDDSGISPF